MKSEWEELAEEMLFDFGKLVLGEKSGGVIVKLKNNRGIRGAFNAIKAASKKSNPAEYIGAILREIASMVGPRRMLPPEPPRPVRTAEQQAAIDAQIAAYRKQFPQLPPKKAPVRPMREIGKTAMATLMADLASRKTRHQPNE